MILFLLGMFIALLCAAVVFGPGPDRFRRFLVNLEKEYAHGRQIRWREVRPVLRSATSADEKLTALGRLIGNVSIDPDLYSKFELASRPHDKPPLHARPAGAH